MNQVQICQVRCTPVVHETEGEDSCGELRMIDLLCNDPIESEAYDKASCVNRVVYSE